MDIISAAGFGYTKVWQERAYLLRLGAVPFLFVLIDHALTMQLTTPAQFMRQGLLFLPAFFAKGWFLAQFLRTLLMNERWPYRLEGRNGGLINLEQLMIRARGILASLIAFVVMNMGIWLLLSAFLSGAQEAYQTGQIEAAEPDNRMYVPAFILVAATLYAVRYIWVYIPAAVLVPPRVFLSQIGGFVTSIHLAALALICIIPPMLLGIMLSSLILGGNANLLQTNPVILGIAVIFAQFIQMVIWCICTAAVAFMLRDYLPRAEGTLSNGDQPPTYH